MLSNKLFEQNFFTLYFSAKGRISRGLFWKSFFTGYCGVIGLFFVLTILQGLGKLNDASIGFLVLGLCVLAYYGLFNLTVKRLHDFNFSGWWSLPSLVMIVPLIAICFARGNKGENKYGHNAIEYENFRLSINKSNGLPPPPPPLDNPISKIILSLIMILPIPSLVIAGLTNTSQISTKEVNTIENDLPFILEPGDIYQKVEATDDVEAYYIVTKANGIIEHYSLDGVLQWSNAESEIDLEEEKINFVKKLYIKEISENSYHVIEENSSLELQELFKQRDAISDRNQGEMCDWVGRVLVPGNGDITLSINDIHVSLLSNGLVRALFKADDENIIRDFDIQCINGQCKIHDIYYPNSYKQELKEIAEKNICTSLDTNNDANKIVTGSGLGYESIVEGSGRMPTEDSIVVVHYEGKLIDGTVFDSSYQRGQYIEFPLNQVIPGWTEGLQLMKEGGKATLYIPPHLAYGKQGVPGMIPPNSELTFEVELIEVK